MSSQPSRPGLETDLRRGLLDGYELGNRYTVVSNYQGNRGLNGTRFRRQAGSSMEFLEHRDYHPGDDLRHVDWSVMAKREMVYIKCYEQESTPVLDIVIDHSRSMCLRDMDEDQKSTKGRSVLKLLGALYAAARSAHFHVKIWLAGSGVGPAESRTAVQGGCHLFPIPGGHPGSWPIPDFSSEQTLGEAFLERPPSFRPNGYRMLISDFLFDADPAPITQQMAQNSQRCVMIQMLNQSDRSPPEHGSLRVIDSETGETRNVYIDSQLQRQYAQTLENHQAKWHESASRNGCLFVPLTAENVQSRDSLRELEELQIISSSKAATP